MVEQATGTQPLSELGSAGSPWQTASSPQSEASTHGLVQKASVVSAKSTVQAQARRASGLPHSPPPLVQGCPTLNELPQTGMHGSDGGGRLSLQGCGSQQPASATASAAAATRIAPAKRAARGSSTRSRCTSRWGSGRGP